MQTAKELFLHELSDMLDAEHKILEALSQQIEESTSSNLQSAFQAHRKQTQGQVERLEQCFEQLGEEPEQTQCAGIGGLIEEHDSMNEEDPSADIMDVFNVAAGIKVERYEISAYESLIRLADLLDENKVSKLLKQNLKEEEQTLKKLSSLSTKVKPVNLESSDEQEDGRSEEPATRKGPQVVRKQGQRGGRKAA